MSAIPMKEITLEQAMKDQGAGLWVVNRSVRPGLSAGQVHITVHESNGQAINVRIPVTHIPVDLTTSATRKALLECPSLRNALQKGLIGLVSSESALAIISTPEAGPNMNASTAPSANAHNPQRNCSRRAQGCHCSSRGQSVPASSAHRAQHRRRRKPRRQPQAEREGLHARRPRLHRQQQHLGPRQSNCCCDDRQLTSLSRQQKARRPVKDRRAFLRPAYCDKTFSWAFK